MLHHYEVEFVELDNGVKPFESFIESLEEEVQAEVFATIDDFIYKKNHALKIKENLSKLLEDGIFELRTTFADGIARTLYFYLSGKRVIITHGFIKKSQKTPRQEIDRAKALRLAHTKKGSQ